MKNEKKANTYNWQVCQFTHTSFIVYVFMFECSFFSLSLSFFSRYYSISTAKEFKKVKRIALITIIDVFIVIVLISFSHHAYISTQKPQHQMIAMVKIVDNFVCMAVVCRLTFKTYKLTGLIFQQALSLSLALPISTMDTWCVFLCNAHRMKNTRWKNNKPIKNSRPCCSNIK